MRVLYLAYRFPYPPDKGERIRSYHQVRALSERFEVHLVCPRPPATEASGAELDDCCASVRLVGPPRVPSVLRQLAHLAKGEARTLGVHPWRALGEAAARATQQTRMDVVLASTLFVAPATRRIGDVPKAIDFIDVYSEVLGASARLPHRHGSWLDRLEQRRLADYEARIASHFDCSIFVSHAEARLFRGISSASVSVVGNGVDQDYFRPQPTQLEDRDRVVFVGSMDYSLNIDAVCYFADEVMPRLRCEVPGMRFQVVGRRPSRRVRRLARHGDIEVTGEVADVRPFLSGAIVAVAPLRFAQGVQNKVLEAMAMGTPVVASPAAAAGLDLRDDDTLPIAEDPSSFVRQIRRLTDDADYRQSTIANGRRYVERAHSWRDKGEDLCDLLEGLCASPRPRVDAHD